MPAARRLWKAEMDRLLLRNRRLDLLHSIDLLQLALRLRRLARLGPEAIGKLLERSNFFLLVLVGRKLLLFARRLLFDVAVPVPAIPVQPPVRDLNDGTDELIQKLAIVRDHEDRARITREVILKPDERFEIEMVRRLVEQQQLWLLDKQTREMRPHYPAATQRSCRPVEIRFAKSQARQDPLGLRFELPAAVLIKEMKGFVVFRRIFRRRFQDSLRPDQLWRNRARQFENRFVASRCVFLRQISNRGRFLQGNLAFIR